MEVKDTSNLFSNLLNCPIITTHKCGEDDNFKLAYLDYVLLEDDKDDNDPSSWIEKPPFGETQNATRIGLKLKVVEGKLNDKITTDPDSDLITHDYYIISRAVESIINIAYANSQAYINKGNENIFSLDLSEKSKVDPGKKILNYG